MAALNKCWTSLSGNWVLRATGVPCTNRALIIGPTRAGYYRLELWSDDGDFQMDWEPHVKSKNIKALKAIGRIEAARRLHV